MKTTLFLIFAMSAWLTGCDTGKKIDSQKVAEEMRSRKILHVNQAQITESAFQEGRALTQWLDKRLLTQLKNAPEQKDITQWAARCNLRLLSADSLAQAHATTIQRIALRADAKKLKISDKALQVWDAYRYNAENKLTMEPNVQRDGEAFLLYSSPILLTEAMCLQCHGVVGKDLTTRDFQSLKRVYPAIDSLVGNTANQPIGVWNLLLDKSRLAQRVKLK